jgi:uncharacterized protein
MTKKARRGFALMSPEKRKAIAARGGANVPKERRTFFQDSGLAAAAGAVGGRMVPRENRTFAKNRALAQAAGRKGGLSKQRKREKETV